MKYFFKNQFSSQTIESDCQGNKHLCLLKSITANAQIPCHQNDQPHMAADAHQLTS